MGRVLTARVHVTDGRGRAHVFAPGDEVPDWATEKITNPKVWAGDSVAPEKPAGSEKDPPVDRPPEHGTGSSREAWVAYVNTARPDVTLTDEMTRRDIIAACSREQVD